MLRKICVAAAALSLAVVGMTSATAHPTHLTPTHFKFYSQQSGAFRCVGVVQGPYAGYGRLSAKMHGWERRAETQPFKTAHVRTVLSAQKDIDGVWVTINKSNDNGGPGDGFLFEGLKYQGRLGATRHQGQTNLAPFRYDQSNTNVGPLEHPRLRVYAQSHGLWRLVTNTVLRNVDGVIVAHLRTVNGSCTLD